MFTQWNATEQEKGVKDRYNNTNNALAESQKHNAKQKKPRYKRVTTV